MKVRFEATFEELVDVNMRAWRASAAARSLRRRDIAVFLLMMAAGAMVASLLAGAPMVGAIITALIAAAVLAPIYPRIYDWSLRRRLTRIVRESAGPGDSWPVDVELDDRGIHVSTRDGASLMPWTTVRAINDLPEGIEVRTGESGILMIRSRAFDSSDTRTAFIEETRKHVPTGTLSGAHGET